ncbi:hypothetical protein EVA_11781 [gut metagenome]|uniref:Uncharacterized protein n=1 Tax=gut metagenome TaxID=749906 RepID=J9FYS6_9ZZZZ
MRCWAAVDRVEGCRAEEQFPSIYNRCVLLIAATLMEDFTAKSSYLDKKRYITFSEKYILFF